MHKKLENVTYIYHCPSDGIIIIWATCSMYLRYIPIIECQNDKTSFLIFKAKNTVGQKQKYMSSFSFLNTRLQSFYINNVYRNTSPNKNLASSKLHHWKGWITLNLFRR